MKKMILIPIIILMIAALIPSAAFAEAADPTEKTSQKEIGLTPFSLPKDQQIPSGTGLQTADPSASAVRPSAASKNVPGASKEAYKSTDKNSQDIMDRIIAQAYEGVPVKLISINVIPYIPDGRPSPCS